MFHPHRLLMPYLDLFLKFVDSLIVECLKFFPFEFWSNGMGKTLNFKYSNVLKEVYFMYYIRMMKREKLDGN